MTFNNGGTVSGLITVSNGGHLAVLSGGEALDVVVSSGGDVTVASGGTVTSGGNGITGSGGPGVIINSGSIAGGATAAGVYLHAGGSVTNAASASISAGNDGIFVLGSAGTVVNSGTISATRYALFAGGIVMASGGSVTNAANASIVGGPFGVDIAGGAATVVNSGSILALSSGIGVALGAAGSVVNAASATVVGSIGVKATSGGTVTNGGTITGSGGTAVYFGGSAGGTVVVDPGAVFSGIVEGNASFSNTLELASGSSTGTLTGLGTRFTNFGGVTIASSASWMLTGTNTPTGHFYDSGTLTNAGTLTGQVRLGSGAVVTNAAGALLSAGGPIYASGGNDVVNSGTISGTGGFEVYIASGGGSVANAAGAAISGGYGGIFFGGGFGGTVVNSGAIGAASSKYGVLIQNGGTVSYTLPANIDALFLFAGAHGTGNGDAAGDALYALDAGNAQTLTGNSPNDSFVVYNSSDVLVPKAGSHDVVYAAASYTLPTGIDVLILEAGTQAVGNSDAAGDALYAASPGQVATLTGNSANDTFVVYNSADVVVPKAGSHDLVYSAVNYTLPTGVDSLILEVGAQAVGNSDAVGDTLYAANAGVAQTLTGHSHNDTFVVYNSGDVVVGQAGSTDTVYAAASFTLPTNVDTLFLEATASHGTGNNDANNLLFGNTGVASTLVAGSGADLLVVAGTAGTILTGGAGHDTFAFPNVMGHDEVTNFGVAKDTLQFNATLFSNFTAAMNAAGQVGANTVFTIDANDTVTLDNVTKTSLTAGNFHFT